MTKVQQFVRVRYPFNDYQVDKLLIILLETNIMYRLHLILPE